MKDILEAISIAILISEIVELAEDLGEEPNGEIGIILKEAKKLQCPHLNKFNCQIPKCPFIHLG